MTFEMAGYSLLPALPELVLVVGAMALLMLGAWQGQSATPVVTTLAVILLVVTGAIEWMLPSGRLVTFGGSWVVDDFARFLKILALIGSAATLLLSAEFLRDPSRRIFEYAILVMLSTVGMMVLISAGDLISLYLGFELMSLALYVVAASNRDNAKSTEAGLKYFVLGALSSGMLLYGASLVYGFTGSVNFADIAKAATGGSIGLVFGLVFLLAGLCFKVSAVPFHMWTPDVYEGAPTPVTAFFASAPKVAALAIFTRVALTAFPERDPAMATDRRVRCDCIDGAGLVRGDRPKEHQTADGLFLDRAHGVRAGRAGRGHRRGRAGRHRVHCDLCRHDAWLLRRHSGDEAQRPSCRDHRGLRRAVANQPAAGFRLRDAVVLARGHSAARRVLRKILRLRGGNQGRAVHAAR